jgi:hypothetical protein
MILRKDLQVPEFSGLSDFVDWFVRSGMPLLPPKRPEVFLSDDATATCLFRHGQYQVEVYLIHPNPLIPVHEHPGVENLELPQGVWADTVDYNLTQRAGEAHGRGFKERGANQGFVLYSAQKWDEGLTPSTIGARWKGHTAGPKHEALIARFNPGCLVYPGYADVTRRAVSLEIA